VVHRAAGDTDHPRRSSLRQVSLVVVTGYMVRHPVPGNVYAFASYVVGLERLGHRVVYVEESGWPLSCFDPQLGDYGDDPSAGLRIVRSLLARHGAADVPVTYVDRTSDTSWGLRRDEIDEAIAASDLLLDVGGVCWLPSFESARRRALVDMDPLFTQAGMFGGGDLGRHHVYFTYGTNIGQSDCAVPTLGFEWHPTFPPVVEAMWRLGSAPSDGAFTTIANWSAYEGVEVDGHHYGPKSAEFLRIADVPRGSGWPAIVALSGGDERVRVLQEGGWQVRNATCAVPDGPAYRRFIAGSRGELSPAKHGYVASRSGWFSDRTVAYLAAGRPAIVQDTGLGGWLGDRVGVVPFATSAEAIEAVADVARDPKRHAQTARRLVRHHFAHDVVLPRLLQTAGVQGT
jgi:hypothetical protein